MALDQHVAILAHSSLDVPRVNRLNPEKPAAFYAQIAFPPSAGADLQALAAAVAPGGSFAGLEVGVKTNGQLAKPLPGVPSDWFVIRSSTQFAPYVADGAGNHLDQNVQANHATIKSLFYAGKKVRASLSAFFWAHPATGRRGISFNLQGVMAWEDAERLNIGQGVIVNTFQQYADPAKAAGSVATPGQNAQTVATQNTGNPFGGQQQANTGAGAAQGANPFAQQPAGNANPFAQSA